tara:strand:+ start:273 stop:437 length:165 start_codon:yes stop_codon:yes gene_type:complete
MKLIKRWKIFQKKKVVKKFDPNVRVNSEKDTDKEKMNKGFNGKTYTINGIEYDF